MSIAVGELRKGQRPGTFELVAHEKADVPKKLYVTDPVIRRSRALAYYGQRLDGFTDSEIAAFWCRSRQYINQQINGLSDVAKAEMREKRSRSRRAEWALAEMERADA